MTLPLGKCKSLVKSVKRRPPQEDTSTHEVMISQVATVIIYQLPANSGLARSPSVTKEQTTMARPRASNGAASSSTHKGNRAGICEEKEVTIQWNVAKRTTG